MNCWNTLKTKHYSGKRKLKRDSLKSFGMHNGQSAAKPLLEEGSTTIPQGSTMQEHWKCEALDSQSDDIVSSVWKHAAVQMNGIYRE